MITAPHPEYCNVQLYHVKLNMPTEFLCILPCPVIRNVCFDRQCVIIHRAPWCRSPLSAIWGATAADSGPSQVENRSECSLAFSLSGSSSFIFGGNLLSKPKVTYARFFPASLKCGVGLGHYLPTGLSDLCEKVFFEFCLFEACPTRLTQWVL